MTTTTITSGKTRSYTITRKNTLIVDAGATSSRSIIGGTETVSAGGFSVHDFIERLGVANIYGSASDTVVRGSGYLTVFAGGVLVDAVSEGQTDIGGAAYDPIAEGSDFAVGGGGIVYGATVRGGQFDVDSGGAAIDTTASVTVNVDGGALSSAVVSSATLTVDSGGVANYVILKDDGANVQVGRFGSGTLISAFVRFETDITVWSGGVAQDVRVSSGGGEEAMSGGEILGGYVLSGGGIGADQAGATLSGVTVSSGGELALWPGSVAENMTLRPGAVVLVEIKSATASISNGVFDVYDSVDHLALSMTLASGGAGLGVSKTGVSGLYTDFVITKVSGGGSAIPAGATALLAQSLAGFGDAGTLAGSAASHAGVTGALAEVLKPK